jgi:hypothetical protein
MYAKSPGCFFARPEWIRALSSSERIHVLARLAVGAPIRAINALPDAILELAYSLAADPEALVRDVRDGTISGTLSPSVRAQLPHPAPDPTRALALERAAAVDGRLRPRHLWPGLEVVRSFFSGSMVVYRDLVASLYQCAYREQGFYSSETQGAAFVLGDRRDELLLSIHRAFYEFLGADGSCYLAGELVPGAKYMLVVTTRHGMYRLKTHDIFEVIAYHDGAPLLRFLGRDNAVDVAGEKLTEAQVLAAMQAATAELGLEIPEFGLIGIVATQARRARYELVVAGASSAEWARDLAPLLDRLLAAGNPLYQIYRFQTGSLDGVQLRTISPDSFIRLRRRWLGERGEQSKLPRLWDANAVPRELQG